MYDLIEEYDGDAIVEEVINNAKNELSDNLERAFKKFQKERKGYK